VFWSRPVPGASILETTENTIYTAGSARLTAIDAGTGLTQWQTEIRGDVRSVSATPGMLLLVSSEGVQALRTDDGGEIWRSDATTAVAMPVALNQTTVFVAFADRTLLALDRASGAERWRRTLDATPIAMAADEKRVFTGLQGLTLCAFDGGTGRPAWRSTTLAIPIVGDPLLLDGLLAVSLVDTTVREFDVSGGTARPAHRLAGRPGMGPLAAGKYIAVPLTTGSVDLVHRTTRVVTHAAPLTALVFEGAAATRDGTVVVTLGISPSGTSVLTGYRITPPASK
jgi:outer membrane protein assembly factor BamB